MAVIEPGKRIHGIDALRGIAILLGIVLHATIAYKINPLANWPHDPGFQHRFFDLLYSFIHSFRMPLFFLIAGFFARFLYYKSGPIGFIKKRWERIGIPFLVSIFVILPFTIFPFLVNTFSSHYPGNWDMIFSASFQRLVGWNGMAHLWFLYYLIIYYGVALSVLYISHKIPVVHRLLSKLLTASAPLLMLLIFVLLVWVNLMQSPAVYVEVDTGIIPGFGVVSFYFLFFLLGWLMNKQTNLFNWIGKRFWWLLVPGLLLFIPIFIMEQFFPNAYGGPYSRGILKLVAAIQVIGLVLGIIGFFLRFCRTERRVWSYISDASYWMYLIHMAFVAGLQVLFIYTGIPGGLKFALVLIVTTLITLLSYHYLVRYTIIGRYLHGRRERAGN